MTPGLHRGMTAEAYFAIPAVNSSLLKGFSRSALHAQYEMTHPRESDAMSLGTATHAAILEPARFGEQWVEAPRFDRRTTAGKAGWAKFLAETKGKASLSKEDWSACVGMQKAVWAHPLAQSILSAPGPCEVVAIAEMRGELCKARVDKLAAWNGTTVVDVKTTRDARSWAFARDVAKLSYHVQAAFYLDILTELAPMERRWLWIVVESEPPHATAIYEPSALAIEQGRHEWETALKTYRECRDSGVWPGYPMEIQALELPRYAVRPEEWEIQV